METAFKSHHFIKISFNNRKEFTEEVLMQFLFISSINSDGVL